jgi:hypothetical protein
MSWDRDLSAMDGCFKEFSPGIFSGSGEFSLFSGVQRFKKRSNEIRPMQKGSRPAQSFFKAFPVVQGPQ